MEMVDLLLSPPQLHLLKIQHLRPQVLTLLTHDDSTKWNTALFNHMQLVSVGYDNTDWLTVSGLTGLLLNSVWFQFPSGRLVSYKYESNTMQLTILYSYQILFTSCSFTLYL